MTSVEWSHWNDGRVSVLIRYKFPNFTCGTGNSKKEAVRAAMQRLRELDELHARVIAANGGNHV
jgi:hypothetical protein